MKIVVIGGGVSVLELARGFALRPRLADPLELTLVARNLSRRRLLADEIERQWQASGFAGRVMAATHPAALDGADLVLLMLRAGGLAARAADERLAFDEGFVGDEGLGPGGFAAAWRGLPVMKGWARALTRHCPKAKILNLVAPLGITTRSLLEDGVDAWGLCELPLVTRRRLGGDVEQADHQLAYHGQNHLGWFQATGDRGRIALERSVARGDCDGPTLHEWGAAPLHYVEEVALPSIARRRGRPRARGRAAALMEWTDSVLEAIEQRAPDLQQRLGQRRMPWFEHAVFPVLEALLQGRAWDGFLNLPADDWLPGVPPDTVAEFAVRLQGNSVGVVPSPPPPPRVETFLRDLSSSEDLVYRAARDRCEEDLVAALEALPFERPVDFRPHRTAAAVITAAEGSPVATGGAS